MTKYILFRIWVIGIYLEFGAWNLVLPKRHALSAMRSAFYSFLEKA
jgi:hypothetical protein